MSEEDAKTEKHGDNKPIEGSDDVPAGNISPREDLQGLPFSFIHEVAFVILLCSAQLMTQAGLGNTLAPLHIIGSSFGDPGPGQLSWYIAAYSLTVGTFILIAGRLGDIFGHKPLFILGYL